MDGYFLSMARGDLSIVVLTKPNRVALRRPDGAAACDAGLRRTVDVTIGLLVAIVRPIRVVLLYMVVWGFLTATIRLLAGEAIWEFIDRIPNWAIPLAFLCVRGPRRSRHDWLS
jgi:hypothetical protein